MNNDLLCDVTRYAHPEYVKDVSLPTYMPVSSRPANATAVAAKTWWPHHPVKTNLSPNEVPPMEEQLKQLQQHGYSILKSVLNDTAVGGEESGTNPGPDAELANRSVLKSDLEELNIREPVAANQDLVANFFLEGSAELSGRTFSGFPIYGTRTAGERLAALREVYATYGITAYLPVTTTPAGDLAEENVAAFNTGETREQYWRRMSRHFIHRPPTKRTADESHEPEDPFYMIDLGRVVEQMARWRHCLPMVRPHFAVKCNPSLPIMQVLSTLGAGFDCASKQEIRMVLDNGLVDSPDDIIFANPCKQLGDLRAAEAAGVTYVTFDNLAELEKIVRWMPHAKAVIRIKTNDAAAQCAFSTKFGAPLEEVDGLLERAREVGVDIYGVSFHVGSGNSDPSAYVGAIRSAHRVFQQATARGFNCTLLDIGGGYPGLPSLDGVTPSFEDIAAAIRPVLEALFDGVTVISEPGRYFTTATYSLVTNVFATRRLKMTPESKEACRASAEGVVSLETAEEYQYYINDGLYQTFNCIIFDHAHPQLLLLDDGDGADRDEEAEVVAANAEANATSSVRADTANVMVTTTFATDVSSPAPETISPPQPAMSGSQRRKRCEPRPLHITTIFGPTCDSMDCILKKQPFPEMRVGDWLLVPDMGSYTTAAGTVFNGFITKRREFVSSVVL